jgi:Na+/proline symporter
MPHSIVDSITIGVYLVLLIAVGLRVRALNRNSADFFRSGCQGTWWLVGVSDFMSSFSAWTFTGAAGVAFEAGWSVAIIFLANAFGFLLNAIWFAPWFRQLRATTVPEIIRNRFGAATQQFYAWCNVPIRILYSALHLSALAIFTAAAFGLNISDVIIVVGIVILVNAVTGGSWAVLSTDFIQMLVLMPLTVLIATLCIIKIGGPFEFFAAIQNKGLSDQFAVIKPHGMFPNGAYTWLWAGAMFLQGLFMSNSMTSASRYFAAKDGTAARKAALVAGGLTLVGGLVWFIPPITARLLFADEVLASSAAKPAEVAYAVASAKMLPAGLTGLMVVAMFAATGSSMDTGLNQTSAIITRDILPSLCRVLKQPSPAERWMLTIGRIATALLGVIIIQLALYFSGTKGAGIFEHMLALGSMLVMPMSIPLFLALFVKRAPWWSALFSMVCALVPSAISLSDSNAGNPWSFQKEIFWGVSVGVLSFLMTIPFWQFATADYRASVARFFETMHRPVDFAKEVGVESDNRQLRTAGWFAALIGSLVCLLALLPNPTAGRIQILSIGGSVAALGLFMARAGRVRTPGASSPNPTSDVAVPGAPNLGGTP